MIGDVSHLLINKTRYTAREYANRFDVSRNDGNTMDWDELMAVKNIVLGKNRSAIEIYPKSSQIILPSNTRHLFSTLLIEFVVGELSKTI